jgi:hypothetical protein
MKKQNMQTNVGSLLVAEQATRAAEVIFFGTLKQQFEVERLVLIVYLKKAQASNILHTGCSATNIFAIKSNGD